jgi:hypothetical protein
MADTIKQKIVFAMGTTGTAKATKSFGQMAVKVAAVGAAVAIAVKGMSKLYDEAVQLDRQLKALNTDMSQYNEQTKGLIGTNDGLSAAIQLQEAGIKATREEMAAMGKAAIQMNQRLGGAPEGATTIFNGLVKSVVNARETGLVKFGVELSQTANKTEASQEALAKLTEKFSGVNVEAETAKEKLFAFNNSLGTVAAAQFNGMLFNMNEAMMGVADSTGLGTDALTQFEQDIMDTNGTVTEYTGSLAGMHRAGASWIAHLLNDRQAMINLNAEYQEHVDVLKNIEWRKARIAGYQQESASLAESTKLFQTAMDVEGTAWRDRQIAGRKLQTSIRSKSSDELTPTDREFMAQGGMNIDYSDIKIKKPPKRTSGRAAPRPQTIDFTGGLGSISDDITSLPTLSSTADDFGLTGSIGQDTMFGGGSVDSIGGDLGLGEITQQRVALQQNMFNSLLGLEGQYYAESNRMHALSNEQRAQATQDMVSTTGAILSNASKAINAESEKGFKAKQIADYSLNAITTAGSAISGFKSVMDSAVPFPLNVAMGGALATSITAAGMSAGRKIREQKYGGGSSGSISTPKVSFPSGGMGAGAGQGNQTFNFAVNVDGNTIHKSMIDANDLANQSGEKHFTTGTN